MEDVRPTFRAFVARALGEEGRAWLSTLPELRERVASEWSLRTGAELAGGSLAWTCEAWTEDGSEAVLKLGPPWPRVADEIAALRAWDGVGAPRLLRADVARHALLLERVRPGAHPDPGSAVEVAALLRALHVAPPAGLPPLGETVRRRLRRAADDGRASPEKFAWALDTVERLERDPPSPVLVHGDLDERNLLTCERRALVAIDPLPCVGDPSYDAAYWVHANRRPGRRARLEALLGASGLPRERVRDWAGVIGVHG
jgi:streptomycin 6-kinase